MSLKGWFSDLIVFFYLKKLHRCQTFSDDGISLDSVVKANWRILETTIKVALNIITIPTFSF